MNVFSYICEFFEGTNINFIEIVQNCVKNQYKHDLF